MGGGNVEALGLQGVGGVSMEAVGVKGGGIFSLVTN